MAKIGSACGGESRNDAHLGEGAGCGDRGAAEAGQVVAIGAGDALDQAEPAHATDLPGKSSRAQAGNKGSQVCSAQSADVELRALQGAEQCLLASLEPRGGGGAVWSGGTYGDLKVADGSPAWLRGPEAPRLASRTETMKLFYLPGSCALGPNIALE